VSFVHDGIPKSTPFCSKHNPTKAFGSHEHEKIPRFHKERRKAKIRNGIFADGQTINY